MERNSMEYFIKTVEGNATNLDTVLNLNLPRGNYFKACGMTFRWVGTDPDGRPRYVLVSGIDPKESARHLSAECRYQNFLFEELERQKKRSTPWYTKLLTLIIG